MGSGLKGESTKWQTSGIQSGQFAGVPLMGRFVVKFLSRHCRDWGHQPHPTAKHKRKLTELHGVSNQTKDICKEAARLADPKSSTTLPLRQCCQRKKEQDQPGHGQVSTRACNRAISLARALLGEARCRITQFLPEPKRHQGVE